MNTYEIISSLNNPLVKRIRRLQEKTRYRQKEEAFWAEGFPIVSLALAAKMRVETVVWCERLLTNETRATLMVCQRRDMPCVSVFENVFRHLSQRNNPDGLGVICKAQWQSIRSLHVTASDVIIAVEDLSDPGNLGTILRTMDGMQATALVLVGQSTQPFHPRVVMASRGAIFTVPLYHCTNACELYEWAASQKIQTIATSAKADLSFWKAAYRFPALFLFGNEHRGLNTIALQAADQIVTIPMGGQQSSLNVAVAVGMVLCELKRRRMLDRAKE